MDFWYWSFALGACCVAWATVLLAHTGHDLEPWSVQNSKKKTQNDGSYLEDGLPGLGYVVGINPLYKP